MKKFVSQEEDCAENIIMQAILKCAQTKLKTSEGRKGGKDRRVRQLGV